MSLQENQTNNEVAVSVKNTWNTLTDELPTLDALSFYHEHCPSRSCLCHNRVPPLDKSNGTFVSAFGAVVPARKLSVGDAPSSKSWCFEKCSPPSAASPVTGDVHSHLGRNVGAISSPHCDKIFGCGDRANNGPSRNVSSFAQLCDTSLSANPQILTDANESSSGSFEACCRSDSRHQKHSEHPSEQEINLSDLKSVLLNTAENKVSDEFPVHRCDKPGDCSRACTCTPQSPRTDDCTFDELAGYFDNFCYIPKNMSPMAEMMYM